MRYQTKKEQFFFYFGYMARRKGLAYALDGFRKYILNNPKSKFKLVLAGGVIKGQEESLDEILKIIKRSKLEEKVIYKGFIEENQQDLLYQKAYAIVIPASLSMGSSGPLYHANSYGKCILASKIGHYLEDIDHKKTGILVENGKWSKAFEYVIRHPKIVKSIEKNVVQKALSRSPIKTANKYLKIYKQLT